MITDQDINYGTEQWTRERVSVLTSTQVLIVKLGWTETLVADQGTSCSLGDVLRTTPLLHLFRDDHVTWLTDARAAALLPGKPYIDEVLTYGPDTWRELAGREFDQVINLECDDRLADILSGVKYGKWFGFPIWTARILKHHDTADDVKDGLLAGLQQGKTWPEVLFQMAGAEYHGEPMVLGGPRSSVITHDIGMNFKVGPKWPVKAWPDEMWKELGERIQGKYTIEFQQHLNDLNGYIDWVSRCKLLVTSDSLGMHIAMALGKKTVALFGPTSFETIPLTDDCIFLHSEPRLACQPCYRPECDRGQECMKNIRVGQVVEAIEQLMR